ncbi:hypothetical protein B0H63DRAFT_535641 [Podospora didyma]|uniref:Uncharacterized protein n=1 Tax=Podospora didyma TaxID=330526 RepID=A0AAE0K145_9PEZI|nr:hypothetical protein B0H63DRAFT_535641 [Podospora didyma]
MTSTVMRLLGAKVVAPPLEPRSTLSAQNHIYEATESPTTPIYIDAENAIQIHQPGESQVHLRPSPSSHTQNIEDDANQMKSYPFSRAFYMKLAPYHVLGRVTIFMYSALLQVFTSMYWNAPFIISVQIFDHLYKSPKHSPDINAFVLFGLFTSCLSVIITLQSMFAMVVVITAKWILLGRRELGNYSWDESSYCQRWQVYLAIEGLRRHCFRGGGILGMLTGTHCLIFTEPDLLTLGDRVAVDDASLVGHINTIGKFDLNYLIVGDRCVLRSGTKAVTSWDQKVLLPHFQNESTSETNQTLVVNPDVCPVEQRMKKLKIAQPI